MESNSGGNTPKKRSLTELTLGWLAEKLRRSEELKAQINSGTYTVNTEKIAEKIVNPSN
jgi:anti-sigma28 factor (negative regulator of flagellin synthesis)